MNYCKINANDIANGPGVRVSLFVSGCTHHCPGCFNKETWDFNYGKLFTNETISSILEELKYSYIKGLTILGGEPLEQSNQEGLLPLLRKVKEQYPKKDIWCFTGYDYEKEVIGYMIDEWTQTKEFLSYIDVLVDGEFIEDQKDLQLKFKGSANQKTIDVSQSLKEGHTIELQL